MSAAPHPKFSVNMAFCKKLFNSANVRAFNKTADDGEMK